MIDRRQFLHTLGGGFGVAGMQGVLQANTIHKTHFAPKAKHVIFLFLNGGMSQVDTFDPKPRLAKEHGQAIKTKVAPTQFNDVGKVLQSPWKFQQYGQSGIPVSELFPHVAKHVDDLCVVRSMTSNFSVSPGITARHVCELPARPCSNRTVSPFPPRR